MNSEIDFEQWTKWIYRINKNQISITWICNHWFILLQQVSLFYLNEKYDI